VDTPATFKESKDWKPAQPADEVPKGKWWEAFKDPQLNALAAQVDISNQNIKLAEAQFRQARALSQAARAAFFPTVGASVSATRSGSPSNARSTTTSSTTGGSSSNTGNNYNLALDASWEPDLWGRVRRSVESAQASEQASAADLESARLSAQAQLAQDYFLLRVQDAQIDLLRRTVEAYAKSLRLTQNQYNAGIVTRADVAQAETQLKATQAQELDAGVQRAQLEHAIALLIGKAPTDFTLTPGNFSMTVPGSGLALPSELLERRPDIAGAERRVAAANAQIGVARAAYFPALTLTAAGGFQSPTVANWLTLPNRYWSVGAALAETLFDAGLRAAQTEAAIAAYDQTVAQYRQTVLTAFQDVEDNLATLRILEQEWSVQDEAVKAAREALDLANNQYKAGTVSYLNVVVAQAAAYSNERTALAILGRRLTASVALVKALGGGWNAAALAQTNH
jgi:NodT family efflux transporter outer membrane factor (OMF) lipoprotein